MFQCCLRLQLLPAMLVACQHAGPALLDSWPFALQMVNQYAVDDQWEEEEQRAAANGGGPCRSNVLYSILPARMWPWVEIVASQWLCPQAGLAGHACGALAGVLYMHADAALGISRRLAAAQRAVCGSVVRMLQRLRPKRTAGAAAAAGGQGAAQAEAAGQAPAAAQAGAAPAANPAGADAQPAAAAGAPAAAQPAQQADRRRRRRQGATDLVLQLGLFAYSLVLGARVTQVSLERRRKAAEREQRRRKERLEQGKRGTGPAA